MTRPLAAQEGWPLVLGAAVTLLDGTSVRYRLTLSGGTSADRYRRKLEITKDNGKSWQAVFDYTYRRENGQRR